MSKVIGIAGSLREGSINGALLRAAVAVAPDGMELEVASIRGIPLYDGDLESEQGVPEVVRTLQAELARADALLVVTPEYNRSIPGPLKNALDWLSRGEGSVNSNCAGMPVGIMGIAPGRFATGFAQQALLPVFRHFAFQVYNGGQMTVADAPRVMEDGEVTDAATRERLAKYLAGFHAFIGGGG